MADQNQISARRTMFEEDHPMVSRLLRRLTTFRVDWSRAGGKHDPNDVADYEPMIDREEVGLERSNIVSSLVKPIPSNFSSDTNDKRHVLAIDLDIPAYLVPSSTSGHSHLYVEVPGGIPHHRYMALLSALADAGIIEKGYAEVSIARGHSDLRLPWVRKDDEIPAAEDPQIPAPPLAIPPIPATPRGDYDLF